MDATRNFTKSQDRSFSPALIRRTGFKEKTLDFLIGLL